MTSHQGVHGGPMALLVVSTSATWSRTCAKVSPLQATLFPSRFLFGRKSASLVHDSPLSLPSTGDVFTHFGILL